MRGDRQSVLNQDDNPEKMEYIPNDGKGKVDGEPEADE